MFRRLIYGLVLTLLSGCAGITPGTITQPLSTELGKAKESLDKTNQALGNISKATSAALSDSKQIKRLSSKIRESAMGAESKTILLLQYYKEHPVKE